VMTKAKTDVDAVRTPSKKPATAGLLGVSVSAGMLFGHIARAMAQSIRRLLPAEKTRG